VSSPIPGGDFLVARRFDRTMTRHPREIAIAWAEAERKAMIGA
jgi:hypothetical protein